MNRIARWLTIAALVHSTIWLCGCKKPMTSTDTYPNPTLHGPAGGDLTGCVTWNGTQWQDCPELDPHGVPHY